MPQAAAACIAPAKGTSASSEKAGPTSCTPTGRPEAPNPAGTAIAKGLDGLFRVAGGGVLPADESATVKSGCLEQSNVKPTEILVDMIEQQRLFAMRSKLVGTARDIDEAGAQLLRLT